MLKDLIEVLQEAEALRVDTLPLVEEVLIELSTIFNSKDLSSQTKAALHLFFSMALEPQDEETRMKLADELLTRLQDNKDREKFCETIKAITIFASLGTRITIVTEAINIANEMITNTMLMKKDFQSTIPKN